MNKKQYRLVFSRVRGMLIAVEETASSSGKTSRGETVRIAQPPRAAVRFALRHAAFAALLAAGAAPLWVQAQVVGAGANAPTVVQTANGLPQVNINKPSGAGVSLNTYSQFDVQKPGVIVNNSPVMTNTQQAGYINGNPNFGANDAARIIINQVNSNNPSLLRGYVEIAGQRAEMIISNPSGLVVDGGGFINTSRAILTTGTPNLNADGSLAGFNTTRGLITVQGAGLNATNVDQVDLIARAVQTNAAIYANTLNVVAGANQVSHDTLQATRIHGEGAAPAVAIDVGQLRGMYSNRIFLVGTEGGVGVRNAGTIAADAMGLTLTTDGRLVQSGKVSSLGNVVISAAGGVENSGTTYGQQSVSLNTGTEVVNTGTLAAQHHVGVNAASLNSTGLLGAGVNSDGAVTQAGDLQLAITGQLNATGKNVAGGNVSATGSGVNLAGSTTAANGNLSLTATNGDVNLANATTSAQGTVTANGAGTIINDRGNLTSGGSTTLTGGNVSNQGGYVSSQGALSVTASGQIANQSGILVSQSTMALRGGTIANNQGTIQSAGHAEIAGTTIDNTSGRITSLNSDGLVLTATGRLMNAAGTTANGAQGGVIGGNGDVMVQGGTIANHAAITSNANLRVSAQSVDNGGGTLKAAQQVAVDAGSHLTNSGGTIVGRTAALTGATLDNSAGDVQADQISLTASDVVNHDGTITQTGTGAMTVNVSGTLDNSRGGTLQSNSTDLTLAPASLVNDGGTIRHAGAGMLTLGDGTGSVSNVGGAIAGNGRIAAQTGSLNNTSGAINAQNGLTAVIGGTLNNTNGKLLSNTGVGVASGTLTNDGGQIGAGTNASIQVGSMTNRGGSIVAPDLSLKASVSLDNSGGTLEANRLALTAANLANHGGTITQYGSSAMDVDVSGTLDNSAGGVIQTNSTDLALAPAELNNAGGTITHAGTGTLTIEPGKGAGALNNAAGTIVTKGQAIVGASRWNNADGIFAALGGIRASIAADVNNAQGLVRAGTSLSLTNGGALVNRGGHIQAGQAAAGDTSTLAVQSGSIDNTDGSIADLGGGTMTVQGGSQIINSQAGGVSGMGAITGNGDVTVSAASIVNTQGGQLSGASLHVRGDTLDNSGGQIGNVTNSSGDVDVTMGGVVTNTNGQISSTHDLTVTAAALQGGGTYSATNDASVNLRGDYTTTADTRFNVGHDLAFTLPGTFANNAGLQSVNNLSIHAGNVVNVGAMMAGGLLHTQSGNLTNTGSIVGGSTSLNATGTVSNLGPTALIGASDSNGLLEILAHDIENRDDTSTTDTMATTAIFGMGRVVLAGGKDAGGNYTNAALVNNVSALIQSGGDMELHADKLTNTRRVMTTTGYTSNVDPAVLEKYGISMSGCAAYYMEACSGKDVHWINLSRDPNYPDYDPEPIIEALKLQPGGVFTVPPNGGQWNSGYQYTTYTGVALANMIKDISAAGQIMSGGAIDASSSGTVQNYWSNIAAVGDLKLPARYDGDGWAATGQQAPGVTVTYSGYYHYNNYDNSEHNWTLPFGDAPFVGGRPDGYTQAAPADVKKFTLPDYRSTLGSNGTISGTGVSIDNTAGNASIPSLGLLRGQGVPGLTIDGLTGNATGTKSGASAVHGGSTAVDPVVASATALNVLNNLTIPQGGLYRPDTSPNASYAIETNPAFTNQKNFISSDYFFGQLGVDLTHIPKRLGDGFYEQQLVRNEVTALTGRAVLGPYTDLETMYQSLMAAGAGLSKALALPIGASLSADQVSKLTSNVIMMETRVVDGQAVLVPVVYLAQANQQNVNGPLITATDIDLKDAQHFTNSGTVKADNTLSIQGKQIDNAFGALQSGGLMSLTTDGNVDLTSAKVKAGSLNLNAGGDLILDTATHTDKQVSRDGATNVKTTLGPTAQLDVIGDAAIKTGGNFQQNAGNLTVGGNLGADIGGDWTLGAQQTGEHKIVQRANGVSNTDLNSVVGSSVKVGGQTNVVVGGDLTAKGAQIELGQGGTIAAKGNVTLGAASATSTVNANSSGDGGSRSYAETLHSTSQTLTGTTLTGGNTVNLVSGKDLTVSGSAISLEKGNANLLAVGDVNVGAATESREFSSHEAHSHSGVVSGSKVASGIDQTMTLNHGSLVSADGVNIVSGKDVNVQGSTVVGTNDVGIAAARNVTITTSQDTVQSSTYYQKKESGLMSGGGLSVSVGSSSLKTTSQMSEVSNNGSAVGSLNGNLSITAGNDLHVTGSDLIAGQNLSGTGANVTIDAAQDKNHRGQTQEVSKSGVTLALKAPVIDAVSNAVDQSRAAGKSQDGRAAALHGMAAASAAWDANLAAGDLVNALGAGKTPEFKVEVSVGSSHSSSAFTENSVTNRGSSVTAGGTAAFAATGNGQAGSGNVTIAGSNVNANDVILAAKNQVNIINTTDTDSTRSTNESKSASVGVSFGTQGFGISAAMSKANGDGNSDLATQNNSHVTAANGVTIISGGDTNIIGSNVKGHQVNADVGGNLNIESVQDTLSSAAHQSSSGGGFSISQGGASASFSQSKGNATGSYAGVNEQAGIHAGEGGFNINVTGNTDLKGGLIASDADASKNALTTGSISFSDIQNQSHFDASSSGFGAGVTTGDGGMNYGTHGNTSGKNAGGAAPMLGQDESGSDSAKTKSGVSAGTVTIRDSASQKQDVASLNRDTMDTNGTVAKLPDMQNLLDKQADMMAAASAAGEAVSRRIGDYAHRMMEDAAANGDQAGVDAWKEGGANRALMQSAGAALVTALAGGNAVGGAAGAAIASIASGKLNELSSAIAGSDPTGNANMNEALGNIVANALATGAGAAVGGESGAFSGYNVDRFNRQLHPDEKQAIHDKANGDKDEEKRLTRAACYAVKCWAEYPAGSDERNKNFVSEVEVASLTKELDWVSQQKSAGLFEYSFLQKGGDAIKNDPVGVAKDVTKVTLGGMTAKTGAALCTSGIGCVAGGWMTTFGLSEFVEGGSGLYNRYNGINAPGDNPLRWGFNQILPSGWGNVAYDGLNLGAAILTLRAPVPLNMGVADGLNRPVSMFGVVVPKIDNANLLPFIKQPWPYGTTQGFLLFGVGTKGLTLFNDVKNTGEHQ
ncbi:hemagglutinin repeat-containing protein [Burkholderia ambifaria]|uniref:hemagglutinin repeat-containing protein n=1 Tax=Burkholderia ambifaria TaxID=152480 RepID=UPI00158ABFCE|nr:hemagglutinin repeat-containing protein [Burkholderia ambifaria]WDR86091.1 hemagglutinin repeat-containing protein [Burkholderia ambifaria]WDR98723.1 hemagglutinin repeat-containing protein [Burkholderia ambifaria]